MYTDRKLNTFSNHLLATGLTGALIHPDLWAIGDLISPL